MPIPNDAAPTKEKKLKWDPIFDLNRDMLNIIGEEFNAAKLVEEFANQIDGKDAHSVETLAADVFGKYGNQLMERQVELGDNKKYMDRGYEVLKEYAARPDTGPFPYVIQRFVEVVYLGINQKLAEVGILECNVRNVEFWIDKNDCEVFAAMTEKLGEEVVATLPCKHACQCLLKKLLEAKGVNDAEVLHPMDMIKDDLCKFSLFRKHIKLPTVPRLDWNPSGAGKAVVIDTTKIEDGPVVEREEILLDIRELLPKKVMYETGGHYDRLKRGQVLKVFSAGDLQWLEKRLRMLRPGQFKCELSVDEKEGCHLAMVERL